MSRQQVVVGDDLPAWQARDGASLWEMARVRGQLDLPYRSSDIIADETARLSCIRS